MAPVRRSIGAQPRNSPHASICVTQETKIHSATKISLTRSSTPFAVHGPSVHTPSIFTHQGLDKDEALPAQFLSEKRVL